MDEDLVIDFLSDFVGFSEFISVSRGEFWLALVILHILHFGTQRVERTESLLPCFFQEGCAALCLVANNERNWHVWMSS